MKKDQRLKIAIFEPSRVFHGGGPKNMANIASYLSKKHDVTIFTQKIYQEGIDFHKSKIKFIRPKNRYLASIAFLIKKLNKKDFDLVIYGAFPSVFANIRNSNIPSINISHTPPRFIYDLKKHLLKNSNFFGKLKVHIKNILFKKLEHLAMMKITKILAVSKEIQKRIKKYYGRNSIIFPSGIDSEKFKTGEYNNYVLSVSRLVSTKRPKMILKSMGLVKNKNIKLIIVGTGNMEKEIEKTSKEYKNVKYKDFVSDKELINLYSNCLAVIYVPINEDLGYAPIEAGASAKLTIGVNEGGLKDTIVDNKTGFLIENVNPEKIAEKIDYVSNNKNIAKKMGKNAYEQSKKFWLKNIFKTLDNTIEEVIRTG